MCQVKEEWRCEIKKRTCEEKIKRVEAFLEEIKKIVADILTKSRQRKDHGPFQEMEMPF